MANGSDFVLVGSFAHHGVEYYGMVAKQDLDGALRVGERREHVEDVVALGPRVAQEERAGGGHLDLARAHRPRRLELGPL